MPAIAPDFASPIGVRSPEEAAQSIAVSSIPDAILVSGPMAGASPELTLVSEVQAAVPTTRGLKSGSHLTCDDPVGCGGRGVLLRNPTAWLMC